jgi:hypothetical protein
MDEIQAMAETRLSAYELTDLTIREHEDATHWILSGTACEPGTNRSVEFIMNIIPPVDWDSWGRAAHAQLLMTMAREADD